MSKNKLPEGYQTVMPYLIVKDAAGLQHFMEKVFHAKEKFKSQNAERGILHAEVTIGDSVIMFTDANEEWKTMNAGLYVHVEVADDTYRAALEAGAVSIMDPSDQEYGRSCGVRDPFGNVWWITSPI